METAIVQVYGTTYSVIAVEDDEGAWHPGVCEIGENGECASVIVDAEQTDEAYDDARTCLLRAMAHII